MVASVTSRSRYVRLALVTVAAVVALAVTACINSHAVFTLVADPVLSPATGSYEPPVQVTITVATVGASIRYTSDGTTPTATTGSEYTGAFTVDRTATVSAIATVAGIDSVVVAADYALPKVYVARNGDGMVSVIAGATGTVLQTLTVGGSPVGIGANPQTGWLWVANDGGNAVTLVDADTDMTGNVVSPLPGVRQVAVNTTTNKIYVTTGVTNVYVIDGDTDLASGPIAVGVTPDGIAVNESTNRIYISDSSGDFYVMDGTTDTVVVGPVTAGSQPQGVAVMESSNTIYIVDNIDNEVDVVDGTTDTLTGTVVLSGAGTPWDIAINQTTGFGYVAGGDFGPGTVKVFDTSTDVEVASIVVGDNPQYVAVDENLNRVYAASRDALQVAVIDGATNTVVDTWAIGAGSDPEGVAVIP